jgi:nucleoside-diphosphate-sugar epimerase
LLGAPALFLDLAGMFWGSRLDLGTYVRYVTTDLLFDSGKAQRLLRWKPEYVLLRGVEEMVQEYGVR